MKTDSILSKAEARVSRGYVEGLSGKEIADRLCISYNTVIRHTQNIYEKIGRHSIHGLVAWWFCANFDIELEEIIRRIGAACLLGLFCAYTFGGGEFERTARRARRSRREVEYVIGGQDYDSIEFDE
jgi:DNA-binding CsgD family transcriptional regulator